MLNESYFDGLHISSVRSFGTQITGNNTIINGNAVIYTVPANSELLLSYWYHNTLFGALGIGSIAVYDDSPVLLYYLNQQAGPINSALNVVNNPIPTPRIPEAYTIRVISSAALVETYGGIVGCIYDTA
jgi:hypothetical protein